MQDTIRLKGIEVVGSHGVLAEERMIKQKFIVDLEVDEFAGLSAVSDEMTYSLWYEDLVDDVVAEVSGPSLYFMETLATRIAERIIDRGALSASVTVYKPNFKAAVPVKETSITVRKASPLYDDNIGNRHVVLALSSNEGDSKAILEKAIEKIRALDVYVTGVSSPYIAPADYNGVKGEQEFMTILLGLNTLKSPATLMSDLANIEVSLGRVARTRLAPRRIGISVITFGSLESNFPKITLPHPMAQKTLSILEPWYEIEPHARLSGTPIEELITSLKEGKTAEL